MNTSDRLRAVDASIPGWKAGVPDLPLQDVLLMRLLRVASLGITACIDPVLRPAGLTESSYHTLIIIMAAGEDGTTPGCLCVQVGQAAANMTRILDLLRSEKLVAIKVDARDARRKRIVVTPSGRRLVTAYAAKLAPAITTALGGISAADKRAFERLLRAVVASMDATERMVGASA